MRERKRVYRRRRGSRIERSEKGVEKGGEGMVSVTHMHIHVIHTCTYMYIVCITCPHTCTPIHSHHLSLRGREGGREGVIHTHWANICPF